MQAPVLTHYIIYGKVSCGSQLPLRVKQEKGPIMTKKIYIKEAVCIGCHLCHVYCQQHRSQSKDLIKAFKKEPFPPVSGVRMEEKGPVAFSVRCQQCEDSPCVSACLTGALSRDGESGLVDVDLERCVGCWTCMLVCPFGAIKRDSRQSKMVKCDLCQGEDEPVCVVNCPNEALVCAESDGSPDDSEGKG
tara:strand:+ start:532 stop:1101 length:570 start_codon:yes stop_codon:yes gene_type:complete